MYRLASLAAPGLDKTETVIVVPSSSAAAHVVAGMEATQSLLLVTSTLFDPASLENTSSAGLASIVTATSFFLQETISPNARTANINANLFI